MTEPKADWFRAFFDDDYQRILGALTPDDASDRQVAALVELLGIGAGTRVLDAPCGQGRIGRRLAERGAVVVGLDLSSSQLAAAEASRGDVARDRLAYYQHDLREAIPEVLVDPTSTTGEGGGPEAGGFDVALSLFSSIGYGADHDDARIFENLAAALKHGGAVFVDTMHRDAYVARAARGATNAFRTSDGTLVLEEPVFDPLAGAVTSSWRWWGPRGSGEKVARIRLYTATELTRLLAAAGLDVEGVYAGCSTTPYDATGPDMGGRIGILARKR